MRIKNLRGVSVVRVKKLDSFSLETSKNHQIRNFLQNERLRVNLRIFHLIKKKKHSIACFFSNKKLFYWMNFRFLETYLDWRRFEIWCGWKIFGCFQSLLNAIFQKQTSQSMSGWIALSQTFSQEKKMSRHLCSRFFYLISERVSNF